MMNLRVLKGFVNQKNEVSGRLAERNWETMITHGQENAKITPIPEDTYFGGSSRGFMLGSSLPFPAGLSSISFSSTISNVISTFPYKAHQFDKLSKMYVLIAWNTNSVLFYSLCFFGTHFLIFREKLTNPLFLCSFCNILKCHKMTLQPLHHIKAVLWRHLLAV